MLLSRIVNGFFDLLLAPCGDHRWLVLVVVSLLTGVLLLWLFKVVTPQQRLARARSRLMGRLYELGLYQDDLGVLLRIQKDLLVANLRYLLMALPAVLALLPPAVLVLVQLESRLQHPALDAGEIILVAAAFDPTTSPGIDLLKNAELEVASGLSLDSPRVRDYVQQVVWWRVKVENEGWHELVLVAGDIRHPLTIKAADGLRRHSLKRVRHGWFAALGNPGAEPLPSDSPLLSLEMHPAETEPSLFSQSWFWWFCGISMIGGLAAKRFLRVEI